jgi:hypothetical protein
MIRIRTFRRGVRAAAVNVLRVREWRKIPAANNRGGRMKLITLHDHMNPSQEVLVDSDSISSVAPFGSGSSIQCAQGLVGVHESPHEVAEAIKNG